MAEGTGLALAMVHGTMADSSAKQFGGAITVDSTPGKGTLFRVYLPS
jgi:signal transduction histidine kinase